MVILTKGMLALQMNTQRIPINIFHIIKVSPNVLKINNFTSVVKFVEHNNLRNAFTFTLVADMLFFKWSEKVKCFSNMFGSFMLFEIGRIRWQSRKGVGRFSFEW